MRRAAGCVLISVGGFLVVTAVLAQVYVPGQLLKTPLDVEMTTRLAGTAQMIGPDGVESFDVNVTNRTSTDAEASTDQDVVWMTASCVVVAEPDVPDCVSAVDPDFRLVNAGTKAFATNRRSALGVGEGDVLQGDMESTDGIVNKFPFRTEKKDYPYWDSAIGAAVPAVYDRTQTLKGVETYVFRVEVPETDVEISDGIDGVYSATAEIYIEPLTGAVQNQVVHQERSLPDGTTLFNLDAAFTDDQVASSAEDAKKNVKGLNLLLHTVPLVGYLAGGLALIAGLLLVLFTGRRLDKKSSKVTDPMVGAAAGAGRDSVQAR